MSSINFFTPVVYGDLPVSCTQTLAEYADSYFYWGGQQALVLTIGGESQGIILRDKETSCWRTAVKVITYFTIILPVIVLIAKALLRCGSSFHVYREASFAEALLNGHSQLAKRLKKEGVALSEEDRLLERAYNNDCNFEPAQFMALPQDLKEKIYQVANIYLCKELVLKLNASCGMRQTPLPPRGPAFLSCNMNIIEVESAFRKLFRDLRVVGCLNTQAEFNDRGDARFFNQKVDMDALLGAEYLISKAIDLGLNVRVPKTIAVILPDESNTIAISVARDALDMRLHSPDLQIVKERIYPLDRPATQEEIAEFEALKNATGYKGDYVVGRNSRGEEGIFCTDTSCANFELPPLPAHAAALFEKSGFAARSTPFLFSVSDFIEKI